MVCLCFGSKSETAGRSWPEPLFMHKKVEKVIADWLRRMEQQVLEFQLQKKTDTPIVHTKVRKRTIKT